MDPSPSSSSPSPSSWVSDIPERLKAPPRFGKAELAGELRKVELSLDLTDRYCVEHYAIMRQAKEHTIYTGVCMKVFKRMCQKSTLKMDKVKRDIAATRERVSNLEKRFLAINCQETIDKVKREIMEVDLSDARRQLREEMNQLCEELRLVGELCILFSKCVFTDTRDVREAMMILSIVERNREKLLAKRKEILASMRALRNEDNVDR